MSTEYWAELHIGLEVTARSFASFLFGRDAVTHVEARWDSQTGTRLDDVVVTDEEACDVYQLDGVDYADILDFGVEIAGRFDAEFTYVHHCNNGFRYFFEPSGIQSPYNENNGSEYGATLTIAEVTKHLESLTNLRASLLAFGVDGISQPLVAACSGAG